MCSEEPRNSLESRLNAVEVYWSSPFKLQAQGKEHADQKKRQA